MTRVYVDMVADLFHCGHVAFLRSARAFGDQLVVGIHSDAAVASYKRRPVLTMSERIEAGAGCRYVYEVVGDAPLRVDRAWLCSHRVDLVVHGDDFDELQIRQFYEAALELGIFRTVPYTPGISTTEVLDRLRRRILSEIPTGPGLPSGS